VYALFVLWFIRKIWKYRVFFVFYEKKGKNGKTLYFSVFLSSESKNELTEVLKTNVKIKATILIYSLL